MAYQMAATAVTLNDLEGHSPVAELLVSLNGFPVKVWSAYYTSVHIILEFLRLFGSSILEFCVNINDSG